MNEAELNRLSAEAGREMGRQMIAAAEQIERQIVVFSEDGKRVLFSSKRCRLSRNPDGSITVTDLEAGPPWLRAMAAQQELDGHGE